MSAFSQMNTSGSVGLNKSEPGYRIKHLAGDYGLIVVFFACLVFLSIGTTSFLTIGNLINVIRQSSIIGFIALGMTFVSEQLVHRYSQERIGRVTLNQ